MRDFLGAGQSTNNAVTFLNKRFAEMRCDLKCVIEVMHC